MNCKDFFEGAVPATLRKYPSPDSSSLIEAVRERAKNMENNNTVDKSSHSGLIEITPEYAEPKKSTKIVHAVAGIVGAAAVLTGAVFGLKWLNENGGLKERIPESAPGAAYSQNAATTTAAEQPDFTTIFQAYNSSGENRSGYVELDQRYGVGDDLTVHLKGYSFDGLWANIYYDLIFKDEIMGDASDIKRIWPKNTEYGYCDSVEMDIGKNTVSCIANYRLNAPAESVEVEFGYKDDPKSEIFGMTMSKSTDMIDEPIVTTAVYMTTPPVEATTATTVLPDSSDAETTTTVVDNGVTNERESFISIEFRDMKAEFEFTYYIDGELQEDMTETRDMSDKQHLRWDVKGTGIHKYEIFVRNTDTDASGKLLDMDIDFSKDPPERTINDDSLATDLYREIVEREEKDALDQLKSFAGEDYCFPLEDWKKEVITYRTCDPSTGEHSRTDYRFNIPAESGEPILAVTGGTVIDVSPDVIPDKGEGVNITIQAADGRKWRYSHLSDCYVSEGDNVKSGDRIAAVGVTGWCTGPLVCISFPDSEVIDPAETTE